jgi:hypothetical protein
MVVISYGGQLGCSHITPWRHSWRSGKYITLPPPSGTLDAPHPECAVMRQCLGALPLEPYLQSRATSREDACLTWMLQTGSGHWKRKFRTLKGVSFSCTHPLVSTGLPTLWSRAKGEQEESSEVQSFWSVEPVAQVAWAWWRGHSRICLQRCVSPIASLLEVCVCSLFEHSI